MRTIDEIRENVASGFEDGAAGDRETLLEMLDAAQSRNADLQSMLAAAKALELQLDARIKELTAERGAEDVTNDQ